MKKVLLCSILLLVLLSACGRKESDERAVKVLNREIEYHKANNENIAVKVITKNFTNECSYVDGITYSKVGNEEYYESADKTYKKVNNTWEETEYNKYLDAVCNIDLLFNAELVDYKKTKENIIVSGNIEEKYLQMILPEVENNNKVKITYTFTLDEKLISIKVKDTVEFSLSFENVILPDYIPTE